MNALTEAEASKKICSQAIGTGNYCVGSYCMAWRWESFASRDNPTREPDAGHSFDTMRGYCGLAGRP